MKPRLLFLHSSNNSAVGYYRSRVPARALKAAGYEVTYWEGGSWYGRLKPTPEKWFPRHLGEFDVMFVDRELTWDALALLTSFRHSSPGMRMVLDFDDDYSNIPRWNPVYAKYKQGQQFQQASDAHIMLSELVSVSTQTLAERYAPRAHAIALASNFIDPADWRDLPVDPDRAGDPHLRILYGGAAGHFGDMDAVRPGLEAVLRNPPVPLRLICFGAIPAWMHELSREIPGRLVSLPWTEFTPSTGEPNYREAVAWGGFDLAIAPLVQHPFNEAKSNIKWLEAAMQGIPFVCSKVGPYAEIPDGAAIRLENTPESWEEGLRAVLTDRDLRESLTLVSRGTCEEQWTVDSALKPWQAVVDAALSRPRILSLEDTGLIPPEPATPTSGTGESASQRVAPPS